MFSNREEIHRTRTFFIQFNSAARSVRDFQFQMRENQMKQPVPFGMTQNGQNNWMNLKEKLKQNCDSSQFVECVKNAAFCAYLINLDTKLALIRLISEIFNIFHSFFYVLSFIFFCFFLRRTKIFLTNDLVYKARINGNKWEKGNKLWATSHIWVLSWMPNIHRVNS